MKHLAKHSKNWIYLTHPLGHDPYDSHGTSYMVNTEMTELRKVKEGIVDRYLQNQEKRVEVATAGVYQKSEAVIPAFNGDPLC